MSCISYIIINLVSIRKQKHITLHLNKCDFIDIHRFQRAKPVIIDPGLYGLRKSDVFWVSEQRSIPTAFRLFTGKINLLIFYCYFSICNLLHKVWFFKVKNLHPNAVLPKSNSIVPLGLSGSAWRKKFRS